MLKMYLLIMVLLYSTTANYSNGSIMTLW